MGEKRNRTRACSKIEQLPPDLKFEVDCRLADYKNTYDSICEYVDSQGYKISRTGLCRYAKKSEAAFNRLKQAQEQTEKLVSSTLERFDTGTDPEGRRWRTSIRAEASGGKTLVKSGQLKSSIHAESSDKGVAVGTNKIYAATHQLGATNRTIRAKEGGLLRFKIGDRWISKKEVRVDIPARPFLGISEEDMQEISRIIEDAVTGG